MRREVILLTALSLFSSLPLFGCGRQEEESQQGSVTAIPVAATGVPGPFDGTWQMQAPGVRAGPGVVCGAIDIRFQIKNSEVVGGLSRTPYGASVESSEGFRSAPMSGTVSPDGSVTIRWESYVVTGQIAADRMRLQWQGECGPRTATGTRVASGNFGSAG